MTYQFLDFNIGNGRIRLCNVYSAPGRIILAAIPTPLLRGMVYMADLNARHPDLGDIAPAPNRNGPHLLQHIRRYRLTHWDTGCATHSRGGTLDHIRTSRLVASHVRCSSIPVLFPDHIVLSLHYSIPATPASPHTRTRINIPLKYCQTYISYIANLLPTFNLNSPEDLYFSLVNSIHDFYSRYVTRPHITLRTGARVGMFDARVLAAERKATGARVEWSPSADRGRMMAKRNECEVK